MKARVVVPDLFAGMNKLEKAYAMALESEKRMGTIAAWRYERITLKLADDTRYTPDFWILEADGLTRFDETKGFLRDDARVKLQVAATQFPEFTFRMVKLEKSGAWFVKVIHPL